MNDEEFNYSHNFAVWAGARASQRGFTSVKVLKDALESCGIQSFARNPNVLISAEDFDLSHKQWCEKICEYLQSHDIKKVSYGRAAKLIAVYLKAIVVIPNINSEQAKFIHPPIDRILLQNMSKSEIALKLKEHDRKVLMEANWTKFDSNKYEEVLNIIRQHMGEKPLWQIEKYWTVTVQ